MTEIALFTYATKARGGVVHTLALAEALARLGQVVHVFALERDGHPFFREPRVPHTLIPCAVDEGAPLDARIQAYIDAYHGFLARGGAGRFTVYHAQDCISANALWRLRQERMIPGFVRTVHHVDDFVTPYLIQCQDDSIHRPDQRIVVSRYWQEQLSTMFGVDSDVIYNGVDLERYQPGTVETRRAARAAMGYEDQLVFLHVGGIEPRKNTTRVLRAFEGVQQRLTASGRRGVLVLVGGATLLDHMAYRDAFFRELEASPLELGKDVLHMGSVADDMIPRLYHAADVLVFPSVKEGWGLVALEAMASGLPVLTSDRPVFREYLESERNAVLVDPTSEADIEVGLMRLVDDDALRAHVIAEGMKTATEYSWDRSARAHVALYERMASDPVAASAQ